MKNEFHTQWHLGIFFWFLGLGIFSIPTLADLEEYSMGPTAFEYLLEKHSSIVEEKKLLLYGMQINTLLSLPENQEFPEDYLHDQNRSFLLEKNDTMPLATYTDDIKIQKDADFFVRLDVWEYLKGFENRERGTNQYIEWGKSLLLAIEKNNTQKTAQIEEINAKIDEEEELLSIASKKYTESIIAGNESQSIVLKEEKAQHSRTISLLESTAEELSKRNKTIQAYTKTIQQKVQGAEENKDALIKNVRVKSPSGSYINAIETK